MSEGVSTRRIQISCFGRSRQNVGHGLHQHMRYMLALMPKERHLFFSDLSPEIAVLIKFPHEPVMVSVKTQDTARTLSKI